MPSNNPEYQKQYIRQHYINNKEYYINKAKERDKILKPQIYRFVNRYKVMCGCIDCGYKSNPVALQFDHVKGVKYKNIATMISSGCSLNKIKEEIRKCEVRCANCHSIITHQRRLKTA